MTLWALGQIYDLLEGGGGSGPHQPQCVSSRNCDSQETKFISVYRRKTINTSQVGHMVLADLFFDNFVCHWLVFLFLYCRTELLPC